MKTQEKNNESSVKENCKKVQNFDLNEIKNLDLERSFDKLEKNINNYLEIQNEISKIVNDKFNYFKYEWLKLIKRIDNEGFDKDLTNRFYFVCKIGEKIVYLSTRNDNFYLKNNEGYYENYYVSFTIDEKIKLLMNLSNVIEEFNEDVIVSIGYLRGKYNI